MEVLQNSISAGAVSMPQPSMPPPGSMAPSTSAVAGMPLQHSINSVNTGGFQISPYDTFKVKTVTGLVSQALHQVNQIKVNYNNLQLLKRACANSMQIPMVHRDQMNRLQLLVSQGTQDLHGKIQLINDAIAQFQASP